MLNLSSSLKSLSKILNSKRRKSSVVIKSWKIHDWHVANHSNNIVELWYFQNPILTLLSKLPKFYTKVFKLLIN
ncbi:MAG: hypothetical protein AUI84_07465 [Delftia sp. 13_1_40CM_3_66_6]|nr:MAG: hypothetical protein AUI84_07465 [Delftia sp. 13_1_40CM_3_66_6]